MSADMDLDELERVAKSRDEGHGNAPTVLRLIARVRNADIQLYERAQQRKQHRGERSRLNARVTELEGKADASLALLDRAAADLEAKTAQVEALELIKGEVEGMGRLLARHGMRAEKWKEAAEAGENLANACETRNVTREWAALDCVVRNLRAKIAKARALDTEATASETGDAPPLCAFQIPDGEICARRYPHDGDHVTAEGVVITESEPE